MTAPWEFVGRTAAEVSLWPPWKRAFAADSTGLLAPGGPGNPRALLALSAIRLVAAEQGVLRLGCPDALWETVRACLTATERTHVDHAAMSTGFRMELP